jgi:hypothetical protein
MMKVKFWIKTSGQITREEVLDLMGDFDDEDIEDMLDDWVVRVFPQFHITHRWISYGWDEILAP